MKQNDMIVIALAGVAALLIYQTTKAKTSASGPTAKPGGSGGLVGGGTAEIFNAQGLPFDNGWRYYSDGTSIGPDGAYYLNGQMIWKP